MSQDLLIDRHVENCSQVLRNAAFPSPFSSSASTFTSVPDENELKTFVDNEFNRIRLQLQKLAIFRTALIQASQKIALDPNFGGINTCISSLPSPEEVLENPASLQAVIEFSDPGKRIINGSHSLVVSVDMLGNRLGTVPFNTAIARNLALDHAFFEEFDPALIQHGFSLGVPSDSEARVYLRIALRMLSKSTTLITTQNTIGERIINTVLGKRRKQDLFCIFGPKEKTDTKINILDLSIEKDRETQTAIFNMNFCWAEKHGGGMLTGKTEMRFSIDFREKTLTCVKSRDYDIKKQLIKGPSTTEPKPKRRVA